MELLQCRVCNDGKAEPIGRIPDCGEFGGEVLPSSISGGNLWSCLGCGSMFRSPTITGGELLSLYEQVTGGAWEGLDARRKDSVMVKAFLEGRPGGSILDIGCNAGGFLDALPGPFKKYGLELSQSASHRASAKGIHILGKRISDLDRGLVFDVIVAIDVIEHVLDVEKLLTDALAHIRANGLLIISTGNPDCFFWKRVFKSRFWYCSYAEHVSFPSYKYFCAFACRHQLPVPQRRRFKYLNFNFPLSFICMAHQCIYAVSPPAFREWFKFVRRLNGHTGPLAEHIPVGAAGIFTDHHVVVFRK
jgi:SAM-dependent methyltransferase